MEVLAPVVVARPGAACGSESPSTPDETQTAEAQRQAGMAERLEYVKSLGIDAVMEPELLWIAEEAFNAPLPPGWSTHIDHAGRRFFYDCDSSQSTWRHPMDAVYREAVEALRRAVRLGGFWEAEEELLKLEDRVKLDIRRTTDTDQVQRVTWSLSASLTGAQADPCWLRPYHELRAKGNVISKMKEKMPHLAAAQQPIVDDVAQSRLAANQRPGADEVPRPTLLLRQEPPAPPRGAPQARPERPVCEDPPLAHDLALSAQLRKEGLSKSAVVLRPTGTKGLLGKVPPRQEGLPDVSAAQRPPSETVRTRSASKQQRDALPGWTQQLSATPFPSAETTLVRPHLFQENQSPIVVTRRSKDESSLARALKLHAAVAQLPSTSSRAPRRQDSTPNLPVAHCPSAASVRWRPQPLQEAKLPQLPPAAPASEVDTPPTSKAFCHAAQRASADRSPCAGGRRSPLSRGRSTACFQKDGGPPCSLPAVRSPSSPQAKDRCESFHKSAHFTDAAVVIQCFWRRILARNAAQRRRQTAVLRGGRQPLRDRIELCMEFSRSTTKDVVLRSRPSNRAGCRSASHPCFTREALLRA